MTESHCRTCRELIDSLLLGTLDEGQRIFVRGHLEVCADCRESLNLARHLRRTMKDLQAACTAPHCESDALVRLAIADQTLDADETERLLEHMNECRECRDDFETIRGVSRDLGLSSPVAGADADRVSLLDWMRGFLMRPLPVAGAAVVAVTLVAVILLVGGKGPEAPSGMKPVRGGVDAFRPGSERQKQPLPLSERQAHYPAEPQRAEEVQLAEVIQEPDPDGLAPDGQSPVQDTPERKDEARGSSPPVVGTYYMDLKGPKARVFILDLAEAIEASRGAGAGKAPSQVPILSLELKSPRDPAHLIVTRPPEMLGISSVDVELARAGAESTRWLWPDLPLPTGDGPFEVSLPPEILEEGDYLISFKTAGDFRSEADRPMKFRIHVSCPGE